MNSPFASFGEGPPDGFVAHPDLDRYLTQRTAIVGEARDQLQAASTQLPTTRRAVRVAGNSIGPADSRSTFDHHPAVA
jgi:hypothetical protein